MSTNLILSHVRRPGPQVLAHRVRQWPSRRHDLPRACNLSLLCLWLELGRFSGAGEAPLPAPFHQQPDDFAWSFASEAWSVGYLGWCVRSMPPSPT
jgi:hypothetical protein